ncbi:3310_t:CDS:10, partial [Cetraspora pellucida]
YTILEQDIFDMSSEDRSKLKYPDYWSRDFNAWGNLNDWDTYWIEKQTKSTSITKYKSHLALGDELRCLRKIYTSTHPAYNKILNFEKELKGTDEFCEGFNEFKNMGSDEFTNPADESERVLTSLKTLGNVGIETLFETWRDEFPWLVVDFLPPKGMRDGLKIARKRFHINSEMDFASVERERKRLKRHAGNVLPDSSVLPPPSSSMPTNIQTWSLPSGKFVKDIFAENISRHAEILKDKKKINAADKATLRYGMSRIIDLSAHMRGWFSASERQHMTKDYEEILKVPELAEDANEFIAKVERMVKEGNVNEAYKYCLNQHADASVNTCLYKITRVYSDFLFKVKDGNDLLDCAGEHHTEIDVIVKACAYIVDGLLNGNGIHCKWGESFCPLSKSTSHKKGRKCDVRFLSHAGIDLGEWEFAAEATPTKVVGDRCRSARINQSILNGLLSRNLADKQVDMIKVPFLQIAGIFGQLLVEDMVNGFYIVFPGATFELPTKLAHFGKLKATIKIFNHVMDIFKIDDEKSLQCKSDLFTNHGGYQKINLKNLKY